jgi:hypothetical protein
MDTHNPGKNYLILMGSLRKPLRLPLTSYFKS